MDCSSCAAKIEVATRKIRGVQQVRVSIASQEMELHVDNPTARLPEVERTIERLGYQLARLSAEDNDKIPELSHVTPAYRRALWIVVLLNLDYGIIEIVGGFIAGSQALKADALDFIGDGLISWIGLMAVGWGLAARAKAALLQGFFLAALGLGVLASTTYRVLALYQPQAELMGVLGAIGLAVNVAAAVVLIPHRKGDANVRAVWLFSRNDALSNVAVVVAAALVAWTGTHWPDLIVALVIAGLFLHSAWAIIKDARSDLVRAGNR
ncbi:cation transporter [Bradyrhizobium sp. CNPSo 4026]|nr:cation transporter [Bradyrhizobium cenepequi]